MKFQSIFFDSKLMSLLTLMLTSQFVGGCAKDNLNLETRYTNESAHASLIKHRHDPQELAYFFRELKNRHARTFYWSDWWKQLEDSNFTISSLESEAWKGIFALGKESCANSYGTDQAYLRFLEHQREIGDFEPRSKVVRAFEACQPIIEFAIASDRFQKEIQREDIDFELLAYFQQSILADSGHAESYFNQLDGGIWKQIIDQIDSKGRSEDYADDVQVFTDRIVSSRNTIQSIIGRFLSLESTQSEGGKNLFSEKTRFLILRSNLDVQIEEAEVLSWWQRTSEALLHSISNADFDAISAINFHQEVVEQYANVNIQKAFRNGEGLVEWLQTFDEITTELVSLYHSRPAAFDSVIQLNRNDRSPVSRWIVTMIQGTMDPDEMHFYKQYLQSFGKAKNPLAAWIDSRAILRSAMRLDFWNNLSLVEGQFVRSDRWWGHNKECPILNLRSLKFDLGWHEFDESSIPARFKSGCYQYNGKKPIVLDAKSATYDTLIVASGSNVTSNQFSRAILDISGTPQLNFPYQEERQDAIAFPLIVFGKDQVKNRKSWFVFHYIAQVAGPTIITPDVPPRAMSSGDVVVKRPSDEPLWVRMKGAPSTPGHASYLNGWSTISEKFQYRRSSLDDPWDLACRFVADNFGNPDFLMPDYKLRSVKDSLIYSIDPESIEIPSFDVQLGFREESDIPTQAFVEQLKAWLLPNLPENQIGQLEAISEAFDLQRPVIRQAIEQALVTRASPEFFDPFRAIQVSAFPIRRLEEGEAGERGLDGQSHLENQPLIHFIKSEL